MTINEQTKQLYRLSFVTGFAFEMMLNKKELQQMIKTTKLVGYKKIENNPLTT